MCDPQDEVVPCSDSNNLKRAKQRRIAEAVDRLLALPEVPAPENYQEWEEEYLKGKYSCP